MAKPTPAPAAPAAEIVALAQRVAELEAENARLQAAVPAPSTRRGIPWRSISSALLITVAAILVPVAVVAGWARAELVDEQTFVATFAPLAADPAVQQAVTDAAVSAIAEQVDLGATTNALFDGLDQLGLPPSADSALGLLRGPAEQGLHTILRSSVESFVTSDLFAEVWSMALRTSHRALLATVATPSPDSALIIDSSGQVVLQLGPIVREISAHLAANGFPLAASIPAIDAAVVVAQSDALVLVSTVHSVTTAAGTWLPILALVLLAAGIAVARHRRAATAGAGVGVAIGSGVFLTAAFIGAAVAVAETARVGIPGAAVSAVIDQVLHGMRESAGDLLLIGMATAVIALLMGSARLRSAFVGMNARLATLIGVAAWRHTGWVQFLVVQRALVHTVLIGVPLLLVWLLPMRTSGIVLTGLVALLAWWFVAILRAGAASGVTPDDLLADAASVDSAAETA